MRRSRRELCRNMYAIGMELRRLRSRSTTCFMPCIRPPNHCLIASRTGSISCSLLKDFGYCGSTDMKFSPTQYTEPNPCSLFRSLDSAYDSRWAFLEYPRFSIPLVPQSLSGFRSRLFNRWCVIMPASVAAGLLSGVSSLMELRPFLRLLHQYLVH